MALTEFFTAPSFLWADGDRVAHIAVYYLVLEQISEVASTGSLSEAEAALGVLPPFRR